MRVLLILLLIVYSGITYSQTIREAFEQFKKHAKNVDPVMRDSLVNYFGRFESTSKPYTVVGDITRSQSSAYYLNLDVDSIVLYQDEKEKFLIANSYKNGLLHGLSVGFRMKKGIMYIIPHKNGKIHGRGIYYNKKGILTGLIDYKDGLRHGHVNLYHDDGVRASTAMFIRDTINGLAGFYKKTGRPRSYNTYKMGVLHGPSKYYDHNDVLTFKDTYIHGVLYEKEFFFFKAHKREYGPAYKYLKDPVYRDKRLGNAEDSLFEALHLKQLNARDRHHENGVKFIAQQEYKLAEQEFSKAIELDSLVFNSFFNRGLVRNKLGNIKGACQDFKKASQFGHQPATVEFKKNCGITEE